MTSATFDVIDLKPTHGLDATLVEVTGSIESRNVHAFQDMMEGLATSGVRNLVLDFSSLKFINSSGLGALIKYLEMFEEAGGRIILADVPQKVLRVMKMLGFVEHFLVVQGAEAALEALSDAGA